jgi:hypothetical protein
MKIEINLASIPYQPKSITITFESLDEELGFNHLIGCAEGASCEHDGLRQQARKKLRDLHIASKLAV